MRATDLMEPYPAVDVSDPAVEAARTLGSEHRPALLVFDGPRPLTLLPSSEVLGFVIPPYLREDAALARVLDEKSSDACAQRLRGRSVRDLLGPKLTDLPAVDSDATLVECAAVMTRARSPLAVVLDDGGRLLGAVTAARVLEALLR